MKKLILLLLVLVLTYHLTITAFGEKAAAPPASPNILILHSYNIDFPWTLNQHDSFIQTLKTAGLNPRISVEFLDAKKYVNGIDIGTISQLMTLKYRNRTFDLIYATDNDAFNVLSKIGPSLFPGVPIVASGVNQGTSFEGLSIELHVVVETNEFMETIRLMRQADPKVTTLHIVNDLSTTGQLFKARISEEVQKKMPELTVKWVESLTLEQLSTYAASLKPSDGIMITIYFTDGKQATYQYDEAAKVISAAAPVPLWCNWDFYNDSGTLGGRLLSSDHQGAAAAQLAIQRLQTGKATAVITDTKLLNQTQIDFKVMERFALSEKNFPLETQYINTPPTTFGIPVSFLIGIAVIFVILILIILLLTWAFHNQRIIQKQNQAYLALKTEVIHEQKEILYQLGEMIETRSEDTGKHVKRVSLICKFIGNKLGLDEEHLSELEIAALLHDIGKIGIPEHILNKPGKLTTVESQIMDTHSDIGHTLFHKAELPIFKTASIIAHQHHEYWNGKGRPLGLSGEEIHMYSRITAIVDVLDALLSERVYKNAWSAEDTLAFITEQRDAMFDPKLVDIVVANFDEIIAIRNAHKDALTKVIDEV